MSSIKQKISNTLKKSDEYPALAISQGVLCHYFLQRGSLSQSYQLQLMKMLDVFYKLKTLGREISRGEFSRQFNATWTETKHWFEHLREAGLIQSFQTPNKILWKTTLVSYRMGLDELDYFEVTPEFNKSVLHCSDPNLLRLCYDFVQSLSQEKGIQIQYEIKGDKLLITSTENKAITISTGDSTKSTANIPKLKELPPPQKPIQQQKLNIEPTEKTSKITHRNLKKIKEKPKRTPSLETKENSLLPQKYPIKPLADAFSQLPQSAKEEITYILRYYLPTHQRKAGKNHARQKKTLKTMGQSLGYHVSYEYTRYKLRADEVWRRDKDVEVVIEIETKDGYLKDIITIAIFDPLYGILVLERSTNEVVDTIHAILRHLQINITFLIINMQSHKAFLIHKDFKEFAYDLDKQIRYNRDE